MKAGRQCGDLVHPLVYCPELHFSEFTSAVADMKNSVAVGVEQGGPRSPCEAPDLGSEQGREEIRGGDGPLTCLPAAYPFTRHWGIRPTLKSPIRCIPGFPFAPRVKADPLAQLPGPRGPSLLLSTLGPPPQAPSCRHRERWSLRMGVRRAQGVHRGHPRHGWVEGHDCLLLQDRDNSPSSCAGLFIASHIGFDWPGVWVHLDIAAPVHAVSPGHGGAPAPPTVRPSLAGQPLCFPCRPPPRVWLLPLSPASRAPLWLQSTG